MFKSKDDKLKELVEKRYNKVEKVEEIKEQIAEIAPTKTVLYAPHSIGNKHYIVKFLFDVVLENNIFVPSKSNALVEGVSLLDQPVIAKKHPHDQTNLKFYYDRGVKNENK